MSEQKWFGAKTAFSAKKVQELPEGQPEIAGMLSALCDVQLQLPGSTFVGISKDSAQLLGPSAANSSSDHPVQHLLTAVKLASGKPGAAGLTAAREQRRVDAQAVGHALCFLLHSATETGLLPASLVTLALNVLKDKAPSLLTTALSSLTAAAGASGASAEAVPEGWVKRAEGSKALTKLLQLVGMQPIKQLVFELVAQV